MTPAVAASVLIAEGVRLERLVGDLLELARVGSSSFRVEREVVDLRQVGRDAVDRHAVAARDRGVLLQLDPGGDATGLGDAGRLLQAVSNLVENAVRVTGRGGYVTVLAAPGRVSVQDSGPGLDDEDLERAFERFYLHRRHGAERAGSSGLGLALVDELARAMGARGIAERAPGETGTRFTIELSRPA